MNPAPSLSQVGSVEPMRVSVVVPVLNEAVNLHACLDSAFAGGREVEVIVVDGGSVDASPDIARAAGATVLSSSVPGRSHQLNLGASQARGEVVLFLHADTVLPRNWLAELKAVVRHDARIVGGGFRRRFAHPSPLLRFTCWLAGWRVRWWGCLLGDQAMFVRRAAFNVVGGFPAMQVFEDLEFSLRLREQGRIVLLTACVLSSGRRFEKQGAGRQTLNDFWQTVRYLRSRPKIPAVSPGAPNQPAFRPRL